MNKKNIISLLIFLTASVGISLIWFHKGLLIGTGESGLPFYNTKNILQFIDSTWSIGLMGLPTSTAIVAYPLWFTLAKMENVLPFYIVQASIFFSMLFIGLVFSYFLNLYMFKDIGGKRKWIVFTISSFFYGFNLFVLVEVWNRLQYPYIFFYFLLPAAFIIFTYGLHKRNLFFTFLFNIILLVFSFIFTSFPLIELIWFVIFSYVIFITICSYSSNTKFVLFAYIYFLTTLVQWVLWNIWWIYPFLNSFVSTSYSQNVAYSASGDLAAFQQLSGTLGNLSYIFRLMHMPFFRDIQNVLPVSMSSIPFIMMSYAIPFLTFFPLLIPKKPKIIYFFLGFSLLTIFLMKGVAGPFGTVSLFLFSHIRILEVFRNSFEKFGLVLPFSYLPLLSYSLLMIFQFITKKYSKTIAYIFLYAFGFLIFGILLYPIWNGLVFASTIQPSNNLNILDYVKVPKYYLQANDWLDKDKTNFRNIALPIGGEGITYKWEYGYSGVELSNGLFDKSFVSFNTTTEFIGPIINQIQYTLLRSPENFTELMTILGAKYLMVRSDIDYQLRQMMDPKVISVFLSNQSGQNVDNLIYEKTFGKLDFYKNNDFIGKVFATSTLYIASEQLLFSDIFSLTNFHNGDAFLDTMRDGRYDKSVLQKVKSSLVVEDSVIDTSLTPKITLEEANAQIPVPHYVPGDKLFPFILMKEQVYSRFISDPDQKFFNDILLLNKRLAEIKLVISRNAIGALPAASDNYKHRLLILKNLLEKENIDFLNEHKDYLQKNLYSEEIIFNDLIQNAQNDSVKQKLNTSRAELIALEMKMNIVPLYASRLNPNNTQHERIYKFTIDTQGIYEVLLKAEDIATFYEPIGSKVTFQLNDEVIMQDIVEENGWVNFGSYQLSKGVNEVHILVPDPKNIVQEQTSPEQLTASNSASQRIIPFKNFDPFSSYRVSLNYWLERGGPVSLQLASDIDSKKDGNEVYEWVTYLDRDSYENGWQNKTFTITPLSASTVGIFSIIVPLYNDCFVRNVGDNSLCRTSKSFHDAYNRASSFWYNNLTVTRVFNNPMVLRHQNSGFAAQQLPNISFTKQSSAQYKIKVTNANNPFLLAFLESYHPLWKLSYADTGKNIGEKNHYLIDKYANGWYIDRKGSYQLNLTFVVENNLMIGKITSFIAITVTIITVILYLTRKKHKK